MEAKFLLRLLDREQSVIRPVRWRILDVRKHRLHQLSIARPHTSVLRRDEILIVASPLTAERK